MTTVAIWYQENYPTHPIWACSDSRISDSQSAFQPNAEPLPLLRHSSKIFPITITCKEHGAEPNAIAFQHTIGLAYAGSSLFALNLYAALTPILTNLRGKQGDKVSIKNVAELAKTFLLEFLQSYGAKSGSIAPFEIALFGFCKADETRRVFLLSPTIESSSNGLVPMVKLDEIDFSVSERVFVLGNHKEEISEHIQSIRNSQPVDSFSRQIAPRDAIRQLIKEKRFADIGGTVQLAQANKNGLMQFMDLEGTPADETAINFRYLGFYLNELGNVGPCWFSLPAVVTRPSNIVPE